MSDAKQKSKSSHKPEDATGFLAHLIELRDRLLRIVIVLGVLFIALYPFNGEIFNLLAAPVSEKYELINIDPIGAVLVPMKLTLLIAFFITMPYLLYQLWSFVAPGLYKHEKRLVYPLLISSVVLFFLGVAFVYFVILPTVFIVLPEFLPSVAVFQPDIGFFLSFTTVMFLAFGFGFEIPIATILLISTGITTAEKLREKRPYVIVGAFIVGMILTPPDVISQIMLAIPMWILFELGIYMSRFFKVRVDEAKEASDKANNRASKTSATSAAYIEANDLWAEDDMYTYEDDHDSSDEGLSDEERSILNKDPLSDPDENDQSEPEEKFFDDDHDFDELSDEEMEAELDRIEAEEKANKIIKKKAKARKKAKKAKTNTKNTKKSAKKTTAKKTVKDKKDPKKKK